MGATEVPGDRFQGHRWDWRGTGGWSVAGTPYTGSNWAQPSSPCGQTLPQKLTGGERGLWGRRPGQWALCYRPCR